jgi:NAD(P)-dependent dehydrogenase (short-subunit alcohol dehydrogenase family)
MFATVLGMPTAVVTGARGLGYEVGRGLARNGYRVIFGVRSVDAGNAAADRIRSESPSADVVAEKLDLADLKSVSEFGERVCGQYGPIDLVVNNAGVIMPLQREVTADGFEMQFGTNHLGHFALIASLLPALRASDSPRVVAVASLAHKRGDIDFDDLHWERSYKKMKAYARSKLSNMLFIAELQRRSDVAGWGLTTAAAHPGFAGTEAITRSSDSGLKQRYQALGKYFVPTPESAARSILLVATSPHTKPGDFYGPGGVGEIAGKPKPAKRSPKFYDAELAGRLWAVSEDLTGVRYPTQ